MHAFLTLVYYPSETAVSLLLLSCLSLAPPATPTPRLQPKFTRPRHSPSEYRGRRQASTLIIQTTLNTRNIEQQTTSSPTSSLFSSHKLIHHCLSACLPAPASAPPMPQNQHPKTMPLYKTRMTSPPTSPPVRIISECADPSQVLLGMTGSLRWTGRRGLIVGVSMRRPRPCPNKGELISVAASGSLEV